MSLVRVRWPVVLLLPMLFAVHCSRTEPGRQANADVADGLYPALCETSDPDSARRLCPRGLVLAFDHESTGSTDAPQAYFAIDTTSMVPLVLETLPEVTADGTGREILSVALARRYVSILERFTERHLGERIAVVLDGRVVSAHKIRTVIRAGRIQVSRCDSVSCEILRSKLIE